MKGLDEIAHPVRYDETDSNLDQELFPENRLGPGTYGKVEKYIQQAIERPSPYLTQPVW
jgi:hypothetical protein